MQSGTEEVSVEELASNLSTYKEQLQQVRKLLEDKPGNSEYLDMEKELVEETRSRSDHSEKFPIGNKVQALWSEDGEWYEATIEAHTLNGYYVCYNGWGNKEEVDPDNVRPIEMSVNALLEAEKVAEATKEALKRKIAQAAATDFQSRSLPAKLCIEPDDPEDVNC